MKRILAASVMSCLALAGPAGAVERCNLDDTHGVKVLVRYPVPDDGEPPMKHRVDHIPWNFANTAANHGNPLTTDSPRIIGIGDFTPGGHCEVLWEEREPAVSQVGVVRVAVTEGLLVPMASVFDSGAPRPPLPWDIAGVFDLTEDHRADVLWWHPGTGQLRLWVRAGNGWREVPVIGVLPPAEGGEPVGPVTAIVRPDQQGPPGILWLPNVNDSLGRHFPTSWDGQALKIQDGSVIPGLTGTGWTIAAVEDFDGDGGDDVLQQHVENLTLRICFIGESMPAVCAPVTPWTFWHPNPDYTGWEVAGPR